MNTTITTFIALNALLLGKTPEQIMQECHLTEDEITNALGLESLDHYNKLTRNARDFVEFDDVTKMLINYFAMNSYTLSCICSDGNRNLFASDTLRSLVDNNNFANCLHVIAKSFLPTEIKKAKTDICILDGVIYLPEEYIHDENKFNNAIRTAVLAYFKGSPLLTKTQTRLVLNNCSPNDDLSITPNALGKLITKVAEKGYTLHAIQSIMFLPIHDYSAIYNQTGVVMCGANDGYITLMTVYKNKDKPVVVKAPSDILSKLQKSPYYLKDCYYDNGFIYVRTNVGYKQLILSREVI